MPWVEAELQEHAGRPGDTSRGFGGVGFRSPAADDPDSVTNESVRKANSSWVWGVFSTFESVTDRAKT